MNRDNPRTTPADLTSVDLDATVETRFRAHDRKVRRLSDLVPGDLAYMDPVRLSRPFGHRPEHSGLQDTGTSVPPVPFESDLGRQRIALADFDPDVTTIVGQPMRLVVDLGPAGVLRHVPDLALRHRDDQVTIVDVEPADRLADPEVVETHRVVRAVVERRGWRHEVWTGADPVLTANVRYLGAYRRHYEFVREDVAGAEAAVRMLRLRLGRDPSVGEVLADTDAYVAATTMLPLLGRLLWTHRLTTDMTAVLGYGSVLVLDDHEDRTTRMNYGWAGGAA